ncbi:MAG: glycosyltransferase family 2 protein [Flavobacterium sp.]
MTMKTNLVSIIVPCYNQAQYLDECLQSVFDQTYENWECIIVNDGSSDNTEEVAMRWVSRDVRFKYVFKENGGLSSARNAGLKIAKGDYLQFLDSDDLINKSKIASQLACFNDNIDIVICDYFPFDNETGGFLRSRYMNPFPDIENFKEDIIDKWESQLSIPCHCVLFKSKLLNKKIIKFDESLPNHEDWVFWTQLFYYSSGIFNLKQSLVSYRIHNKSMCIDELKMSVGFILACKSNQSFFEIVGDTKGLKFCLDKLKILENKKEFNLKNVIKLLVPPLLLILKKKLFLR